MYELRWKSIHTIVLEALSVEGVKTPDVAKVIPGISENRNALKAEGYGCSKQDGTLLEKVKVH